MLRTLLQTIRIVFVRIVLMPGTTADDNMPTYVWLWHRQPLAAKSLRWHQAPGNRLAAKRPVHHILNEWNTCKNVNDEYKMRKAPSFELPTSYFAASSNLPLGPSSGPETESYKNLTQEKKFVYAQRKGTHPSISQSWSTLVSAGW